MITTETLKYIIIAKLVNSEPAIAVNNYTYIHGYILIIIIIIQFY